MASKLVAWERFVRYVPQGQTRTVRYGDPIITESEVDRIAEIAAEGRLEVKVLQGDHPLNATPNGQTEKVAQLLGPLEPADVPIIRCIGLNYKTHSTLPAQLHLDTEELTMEQSLRLDVHSQLVRLCSRNRVQPLQTSANRFLYL
jgi:hypothetical protein